MGDDDYSINTGVVRSFGTVDYLFFVLTLVISAGIGVFFAIKDRNRNTTKDFLLGGGKMKVFPVAMSLMVTFMSALTLLGNPVEMYNFHTMFWYLCVAFIIAMTGAAFILIPFFYNLKITSTFEYLEMRFGRLVCLTGCAYCIAQTLIYMAFLLYAPSLALNAVTGVDLWGSVIGMGIVVTFYTTLGGMKAVLWTDTFQAGVIIAGLLAVLIKGSIIEGGFASAWNDANERGRVVFDDFSFDPKTRHSVWSMVVGGWAFWMYLYGINQSQVQRCLSCPTVKKAQLAMFVNLPGLIFIVSTCCMIGIVMFAFYKDCDPIKFGLIDKTDQMVPLYVMDILGDYPGIPGIFVSCVVSGSLSSLSSGLNALSAITLRDICGHTQCLTKLNDFKSTILSKALVVFYGVLAIGLAYAVSHMGSVLQAIYVVFGILNGPLLGVFTLGMFFPWANKHGAFAGMVFSLGFLLWIGIAAFANDIKTPKSPTQVFGCNFTAKPSTPKPKAPTDDDAGIFTDLYKMSYMYYTGLGMILVHGVGLFVSLITGFTRPKSLDPRLICPLGDYLLPCFPESIKKPLRFGIVHEGKYDIKKDTVADENEKPRATTTPDSTSNGTSSYELENGKGKENYAYTTQDEEDVTKTRL